MPLFKNIASALLVLSLMACRSRQPDITVLEVQTPEMELDLLISTDGKVNIDTFYLDQDEIGDGPYREYIPPSNDIPPNGTYAYDIAYAEWQGRSMGESVTVVIKENTIKVFYNGGTTLSHAKKDELLDEGLIVMHQSGDWIIAHHADEANLDEVGGCTGGPSIIDFKSKKYWMC